MKRIICAIIILCIAFCSCERTAEAPRKITEFPYECELNVKFDGREYGIGLKMESSDNTMLSINAPSNIAGLTIRLTNGNVSVSYCGIDIPLTDDYASSHGILLLHRIFAIDNGSLKSASVVKRSGVKYCREHYEDDDTCIDVFYPNGSEYPSFIEATVSGHIFSITFVNNN